MEREGNVEKAILAALAEPSLSRVVERFTRHNQILLHNYQESVERNCDCQLLGCERGFRVTLIPNQAIYPKYCEEHRSEYRRQHFLRMRADQPDVYRFETFRIAVPVYP